MVGANAATHAVAVNAAAAAATGATGAVAVAPDAITTAMRRSRRPQLKAIGRILQIEIQRLKAAASGGGEPAAVAKRVHDTTISRAPIISWALDLWVRTSLEHKAQVSERLARMRERQGKRPLLQGKWQQALMEGYASATRGKIPDILTSLRMLQLELANQIKFGLRTSPLCVFKLLYSSILVTVFALVAQCPGFEAVQAGVSKRWPKLVDHLAATLEKNLAETQRSMETDLEKPLEQMKNQFESITGLDIDGDGHVGKPPPVAVPSSRWERATDIVARPFGRGRVQTARARAAPRVSRLCQWSELTFSI